MLRSISMAACLGAFAVVVSAAFAGAEEIEVGNYGVAANGMP